MRGKMPRMLTARDWKEFYRSEREELGQAGLLALFDRAPQIDLNRGGAIVFPHTRLSASGHQVAAAAQAVVESRCDTLVALGVLHRRERDNPSDRGIHDDAVEVDEFSLDNFCVLLELAARRAGCAAPRVVRRYPFLAGEDPSSLAGMDELRQLRDAGAMIVATTDPIHHGVGYNTPAEGLLPRTSELAHEVARGSVLAQLALLSTRRYEMFARHAEQMRSDFRDVGPVLAELLPGFRFGIAALELVDYSGVLSSAEPTWVAAALVKLSSASPEAHPRASSNTP